MHPSLLLTVLGSALLWISQSATNANEARRSADQDLNYGSFETSVRRCRLEQNGTLRTCNVLQLAQRGDTGLRIRFTGAGQEPDTTIRYTFITRHPQTIRPLKCDQGDCQLLGHPWIAEVISASTAHFDARGLPVQLPQAQAMQGDCQLADQQIRCSSRTRSGQTLNAEADL